MSAILPSSPHRMPWPLAAALILCIAVSFWCLAYGLTTAVLS